jgi:hypothetical protein
LRKAAASKKTPKQQPMEKGIHFPNDQVLQDHIQKITIKILRKWRQCEPKKKDGEPPYGSLSKNWLLTQYKKTQLMVKEL